MCGVYPYGLWLKFYEQQLRHLAFCKPQLLNEVHLLNKHSAAFNDLVMITAQKHVAFDLEVSG